MRSIFTPISVFAIDLVLLPVQLIRYYYQYLNLIRGFDKPYHIKMVTYPNFDIFKHLMLAPNHTNPNRIETTYQDTQILKPKSFLDMFGLMPKKIQIRSSFIFSQLQS